MTTKETITTEQIKALRAEAVAHRDYHQVDICDRALATDTLDQDGNQIALADWSQDEAREECARVIAEAEALRD